MIKIKKSLRMYVPLLLIFAMVSFAEAAEPMDIKGAIERVLKQNASLLSLRQEAAKAAAFKIQADGTLTPELGVSAYQDIQRENQTTDGSNRTDGRTAQIGLVQTICSGGRNSGVRRLKGNAPRPSRFVCSSRSISAPCGMRPAVGVPF